jgi:hypothetical protein
MIFLNGKDIDTLKRHFELLIGNWLKDYTFTRDLQIEISHVKRDDFLAKNGKSSVSENGLAIKYCDSEFKWESLIFSDALHLCPRDSTFNASLLYIKRSFLKEILNIGNFESVEEQESKLFPAAIDAYLRVSITNADVGCLDFFASHSRFALMINKSAKSLSQISLESRESAIKKIKIPMSFSLNFGEIAFKDLLKMENGTVFISELPLENEFSVSICNANVTTASMGKRLDNLAFLLKGKSV